MQSHAECRRLRSLDPPDRLAWTVHFWLSEVLAMLTSPRRQAGHADGMSRRAWLRIGGLALGGLALPDILRAQAATATIAAKGIIMVLLPGGPTHLDTFDPKPDAPAEIR